MQKLPKVEVLSYTSVIHCKTLGGGCPGYAWLMLLNPRVDAIVISSTIAVVLQQLTVNTFLRKGAPGASNSSHVTVLLSTVKSWKDFNISQCGTMKHKQASVRKTLQRHFETLSTWIFITHSPDLGLHLATEVEDWARGGNPAEWSWREFKLPRRPLVTCFRSLLDSTVNKFGFVKVQYN